jgi:hypothetical protein
VVDVTDGAALGDAFSEPLGGDASAALAGLDSSLPPSSPAPSLASPTLPDTTTSSAGAPAAPASSPAPAVASPRFRKIVHRPNMWLLFLLATLTGMALAGSGLGLRLAAAELSRAWRDRVAPIG